MVEEGGIPGILWEDYQCAGFVTETQKQEMRFFMRKLSEAMNTPKMRKRRGANINQPDQTWRKASNPCEVTMVRNKIAPTRAATGVLGAG